MTLNARNRVALTTALSLAALLAVAALSIAGQGSKAATSAGDAAALPPPSNGAISPQDQADALHYIISADREIYGQSDTVRPVSSGPSPCELLRRAAESVQNRGAEFSYALRSLRPGDERNGPQTELEQRGLEFIAAHSAQNYYGQEMLGGRRYFTAVYTDQLAVASCVACHNRRAPASAPRHWIGEVMGGIVVRVPLEF